MQEIKRELSNWFIISFEYKGEMVSEGRLLWGVPVGTDETWCCTSLIESIEGDLVKTQNSVYRLVGDGEEVVLPLSDIERIRSGFSPKNCETLRQLETKGYKVEPGF